MLLILATPLDSPIGGGESLNARLMWPLQIYLMLPMVVVLPSGWRVAARLVPFARMPVIVLIGGLLLFHVPVALALYLPTLSFGGTTEF